MDEGERIREKEGKVKESEGYFAMAFQKAATMLQKGDALGQLGLSNWHRKHYNMARDIWNSQLEIGRINNLPSVSAYALRNLSRKEITEDVQKAYEYAERAYRLAKEAQMTDLVWFAHGVFAVSFLDPELPLLKWLWIEFIAILSPSFWSKQNSALRKVIWAMGFFMDCLSPWGKLSIPFLRIGRFFAKLFRVQLRVDQMTERIADLQKIVAFLLVTILSHR
jgi:tetratricopeptide (TPR) repeat protein